MTPGPEQTASLPPVSVVICCRNSASTLADTLDAVARQEYGGWWEVVVVDNGSTDDTAAVARRFESRVPDLRVVPVPNPGHQARALNVGIRESKSDILVLLDSDDEVGPDYLLHMAKALERHDFVGAAMDVTRLNAPELLGRRDQLQVDGIDSFCGYLPAVVGAAMGVRREPIERIGGFDENLPTQHDLDISWRLAAAGVEPAFVPDATLHYRYRPSARATFLQEFGYGDGEVVAIPHVPRGGDATSHRSAGPRLVGPHRARSARPAPPRRSRQARDHARHERRPPPRLPPLPHLLSVTYP